MGEKENSKKEKHENFLKMLKFEEDQELKELLNIQEELERIGINRKDLQELTKSLSKEQKQRLEDLYKEQIKKLEEDIKNEKNKIIEIRQKIAKN